jgi:prepilin-type N-terminal cleavage/methylation domain-containing protein
MNTLRRDARGFTLLEITIVLAVMAILGLILAPSIVSFLNQSRLARAQNDVRTIGDAVVDFVEDNGFHPQWGDGQRLTRIVLLVSPGAIGEAQPGAEGWLNTQPDAIDLISNQLVNNRPSFGGTGYPLKTPMSGAGWNGPYLSAHVQEDPWGTRYVINVQHLSNSIDAMEADGLQEKRAVWVLSAGPDGIFDTAYPTSLTQLRSNAAASPADISARIQ